MIIVDWDNLIALRLLPQQDVFHGFVKIHLFIRLLWTLLHHLIILDQWFLSLVQLWLLTFSFHLDLGKIWLKR